MLIRDIFIFLRFRFSFVMMIVVVSLFVSLNLKAQDSEGTAAAGAGGKKMRQQTLSFEDELIEGASQKPELAYLLQKKNFNYKKLIKLRENFLPEMRRTADDVQRNRGGN